MASRCYCRRSDIDEQQCAEVLYRQGLRDGTPHRIASSATEIYLIRYLVQHDRIKVSPKGCSRKRNLGPLLTLAKARFVKGVTPSPTSRPLILVGFPFIVQYLCGGIQVQICGTREGKPEATQLDGAVAQPAGW